ncbi:MAG: amino acid adenylation domain-containing protein [Bacteroidaceae bacterium]|nr:amino acid adenylation domain-containing protein [Bacteroidaceae bacterium]
MKTTAPLSREQYGLYVECVEHNGEPCYNIPYLYVLDGSLDGEQLCRAIETVVKAHPTLFTRIEVNADGEPIQTIDDGETFTLTVDDVTNVEQVKAQFVQPFDIHKDRLFRFRLLRDEAHYYLFQDIHHIISDGATRKVLLADIEKAYGGEAITLEELTLGEVAEAEANARKTPAFEEAKSWYAQNFDCSDTFSPLLPDMEETEPKEGLKTRIMNVDVEQVEGFCKTHGIFKSTFFTAAYSFLLAKFNNEHEALFNTIHNGRSDKRLAHSVAMLVKTLPVYSKFTDDTTILDFLNAEQEQMTGCRQHEAYAYADVVTDLNIQPATLFAWHGTLFDNLEFCGKPMTAQRLNNNTREVPIYLKAYLRDGHFCVEAEYSANAYSESLISQYLESYEAIVEGFVSKEYLRDVDITTPSQIEKLDQFNQTDVDYDNTQTIISLFDKQAITTPDAIAVVYKDRRYTYKEVDEISNRIATHIASMGLVEEDVVSVLIPRCEWMAIASLGVLKAGCAYQPLDPSYPKERLNFMMQDSSAKLLIADEELRDIVDEYKGDVLLTKDIPSLPASSNLPDVTVTPASLFILLYTSGSTGVPKGCQLTHGNLVAFCHWYQRFYSLKPEHNVAAYASYGFDACMMDMYPALTCGATVYIIPEELRLDLIALNEYFEANSITHSFMTTQVGFQFASSIENHSLLYLSTGGEKLASLTPPTNYKFYNVYGPTECTIFTTTYLVDRKLKDIPIGSPLDNMCLYIVDAQGHRLPIGASGELWVSGPQVSRGYLNRPEKTAEVYIGNPFATDKKYARVYRTGDIVRYLPDGNIQFVGRRDGQVKIRGFRIELKEVEAVIRDFPGIKDATVQAFDEEGGGKFIAAYIVSDQQIDIEALNNFILDQKPPYMVPAVTMQIENIPLNQNQKVNKKALPKPEKKATAIEESNVPMNVLEKELHDMVAGIVGNQDFGITTVLGYAGLTSISAIKLAVQVNKRFGVTVDSRALVKNGSIQSIENEILGSMLNGQMAVDNGKSKGQSTNDNEKAQLVSVPLSYAQTGVYFECLKNPTSTIYNIPYLLSYPEGTDAGRLAEAVKQVVACHPELSAHFMTEGDQIVQTIDADVLPNIPINEMTEESLFTYKNEFVQPFNLQRPPLYRFEVVKTEYGVHLLMDVHHLVFDGGSADIFIRQICAVLEGSSVEKEGYTYIDFVSDQQLAEDGDAFRSSQQFFAEKLQTCEGASEIPADLPKTDRQGLIGEAVVRADHDKVSAFCRQQEITPAHLFLAATAYVVSRYTNNREVYLSTVSSGRSNLKIADTVGMFVNTLALGLNIDDITVKDFLQKTSETFDETLRHEDYPFARIATDYGFLPSIAFAYQVGVLSEYTIGGKAIRQELLELNVPKFKINIKIETRGVVVQYDDSLYSERVGNALAESIVAVTELMMAQPQAKVRKISIVSKNQEEELSHLRQTATGDAPFKFFHECISHYAQTQPEHEALVAIDASFTYKEMDDVTNCIAANLRNRGVKEHDRVALLLPRTSRLILSLFGVLKAGAAYIPCDPEYPADRIKLILEDSEARYIITTTDRLDSVPAEKAIDVEELMQVLSSENVQCSITPDALAYLIYTSGSTGRPKGVMLRHEGICNYLYGHPANVFANGVLTDADRIISVTTISFDAALQDIGMAFYNGKTLIVATEEQANNPLDLAQLINEQHINMVSGTPSRWQTWLTSEDFCQAISHVKICRAGGEKFSDQLLEQMRDVTKARIFNCYGPTEITVASNNKELTHADLVTVGKPQLNVIEFIVDADGNELPVGVVGELYIGGRGVARGYNNLDEMTRERFIEYHGERIYKSGDYAKWLPDGDVVILGRTDHQIKLRGLRIELGEIENVMLKVNGMKKVVILIRKLNGKEHLCAYYTADHEIAPEDLKAEISKSLTQYMVPTAYLQLKEMPMTPNGKTDVKALPEPQLAITSAYVEPSNETEKAFCDIFANILQMDQVGATDNFFELGGTSLVVTRVIIEADKAGLHVAYGDVFANPTPRKLATLITGTDGESLGESSDPVANYDYSAINNLLRSNTLDNFRHGERRSLGNVLLTGATGYLGIHILRELIDSDAGNIYCLVRGKTQEKAENRLRTLLFYYFADAFKELFGTRIHVILGDVTGEFGDGLQIDTVFNCAAVVKHFSEGTEIEDVNIGGAQRCVDFCLKTKATLVHVSTASTRGMWVGEVKDETFTEQRLYMGQYLGNKYIYSKFMAERLILDAIAMHGLNAKIMRVGNLSARSTDGEFQANFSTNSFMGRIKVYNMLGCCPYSMRNKRVEFSPINEVSHAIVLLATTPKDCTVFHPYNIHGQFLGDVLLGLTTVGKGIRFVEQEDFQQAMNEASNDPQKAKTLSSMLAYQDMAHGQKTADVQRDNDYTTQVLYRLGFSFSPTSWDYVERMLNAIGGFGFFEN